MNNEHITLPEYIEKVESTLKYWLDVHTNPAKWADSWCVDDDWQYTIRECPVIKNNYFEFDIRKHLARYIAKRDRGYYNTCRKCGLIFESWYTGEKCDDCGASFRKTTIAELTKWLEGYGEDLSASDDVIREVLIKEGFKVYREALSDIIAGTVEEVKDCLKQFKTHNPAKLLQAVTWANHVMHVHGNIVQDYGEYAELDYDLVNEVSQNSLAGAFGQSAIDEYLS